MEKRVPAGAQRTGQRRARPPAAWVRGRSASEKAEIAAFWGALSAVDRRALLQGDRVGKEGRAVLVEMPQDLMHTDDDWAFPTDHYEYLVAHEIGFPTETHHICQAHERARAVVSAGLIPGDFVCPLSEGTCPMRRIVGCAGGDVRLIRLGTKPAMFGAWAVRGVASCDRPTGLLQIAWAAATIEAAEALDVATTDAC